MTIITFRGLSSQGGNYGNFFGDKLQWGSRDCLNLCLILSGWALGMTLLNSHS